MLCHCYQRHLNRQCGNTEPSKAKSSQSEKALAPETVKSSKASHVRTEKASLSHGSPLTAPPRPKEHARTKPVPVKSSAAPAQSKSKSSDSKAVPTATAKAIKREAPTSMPKTASEDPKNQMAPVLVTSLTTTSAKQAVAEKKAPPTRKAPHDQSIVSPSMTVA